jgi:hypothetical protein
MYKEISVVITFCDDCGEEVDSKESLHFFDNYSSEIPRPESDICPTCIRKRVCLTFRAAPVGTKLPDCADISGNLYSRAKKASHEG